MSKAMFLFAILVCFNNALGQVIKCHEKVVSVKIDTTLSLKYFKDIEPSLQMALDSFWIFMSQHESKICRDSNFIVQAELSKGSNGSKALRLRYVNDYNFYRIFTESNTKKGTRIVSYALTFFKSTPVLFTISVSPRRYKNVFSSLSNIELVKNVIYEHMRWQVKQQINSPPDLYQTLPSSLTWSYVIK